MQWFIDIIKEWVIAQGYATEIWVEAKMYATVQTVLAIVSAAKKEILVTVRGTRFLAYRHDSTQSIPSGGYHTVQLNDVIFDTEAEWKSANYRVQAKVTGYYQCSFSVGFRPTVGVDKKFFSVLFVNEDYAAIAMNQSSHNDYLSACGSILIHLNAGDVVWLSCSHNSGFNVDLDYTNQLTYLSVSKVP